MAKVIRIPPAISPNEVKWHLDRKVARFTSPLAGTFQRDERPGTQWIGTVNLPPLSDAKAAIMESFLAQVNAGDAHMIFPVQHRKFRGAIPKTQHILNNKFQSGVTSWSAVDSAAVIAIGTRLRVTNGVTTAGAARQTIAGLDTAKSYVMIADYTRQNGATPKIEVRQDSDGAIVSSATGSTTDAAGRLVVGFIPTETTMRFDLRNSTTTTGAATIWQYVSVIEAPRVKGAAQLGESLDIDGLDANITNVVREGDYFTLENFLYQVTESADSDGSGNAQLFFTPTLRSAPADNAAVVFIEPYVKAIMDEQYNYTQGLMFAEGVTFQLREDITR